MSSMKNFKGGDVICKEGEKSKSFFVLVDGKIGIYKNKKLIAEFSKAGDMIGEMSLILKRPRTAEIRANADSSLLEISGELDDIIKMYPDISKKLIKTLAERLAKATEDNK